MLNMVQHRAVVLNVSSETQESLANQQQLPKFDDALLKLEYFPEKNPRKRILVADDVGISMFAMKFLLSEIFKLEDAVVEYAANGKQAFEMFVDSLFRPNPFSLMILDYNMPYLTGLEVVQAIDDFIRTKKLMGKRPFFIV